MKNLKILFIGNSHTYYNDMPQMVRQRASEDGYDCHVTMLAHGGWFLSQHAEEPEPRFNILFGGYDYVVLQEHTHPFAPREQYLSAVKTLTAWIREAGSTPVIYETWAKKTELEVQTYMDRLHREAAEENGALLAPAGRLWWDYIKSHPEAELFYTDGAHASPDGSRLAANCIWETIYRDLCEKNGAD